jgi:hypothetical protein
MNLYNELPLVFPWYDNLQKQNRFKENADRAGIYGLLTPSNGLLPFQILRFLPITSATISSWQIFDLSGNLIASLFTGSFIQIDLSDRKYFLYAGQAVNLSDGTTPFSLAPGYYYSKILFADSTAFYSEVFLVPDCTFTVTAASKFLKIQFWNDSDLAPVHYNYKLSDVQYFKNTVYLDTYIHASDPEAIEETEKDGNDEPVPTFGKVTRRYQFTDEVPDFLKVALVAMQIHDHVVITTPGNLRTGEIKRIQVNSSPDQGGAFSVLEVLFWEDLIVKRGCGENMV